MIRFRTLGGLDLIKDEGTRVRSVLAQPRRVAVLVSLALAGDGGFVRRDVLLGRIWPEVPDDRGRHSLNQVVYGLRKSLGGEVIRSRGDEELGIDPDRLWCDAGAFLEALDERRDEEALGLYQGELLPGFHLDGTPGFQDWLEGRRTRFRDQAVIAAWRASEAAERDGHPATAVSWARRAVDLSGSDELAFQRLLRLLGSTGDRAGAVEAYEAFSRRLAADPGVEPSPETRALMEAIRGEPPSVARGAPSGRASRARVSPPRPGTPLVGRERELGCVRERLEDPGCRLVTITGAGGIGKTRLAQEAALEHGDTFADGVAFAALAGIEDHRDLPGAVARSLGLATTDEDPAEAVARYLASKRLLMVLDNMEHLAAAAPFLAELLEAAPDLTVLVTSREPLRLQAEWVVHLEGLEIPSELNQAPQRAAAVRLFADAARRMTGSFEPDEHAWRVAGEICRLVDGVPLAIELAAAWTRSLSLEALARELETGRRFLANPFRDAPERHGSLQATFDRSWALLDEDQARALAALSVFRGGFDRDAAEFVAGASMTTLDQLLRKSLLRRPSESRYEFLEVIREFAGEQLLETPELAEAARERHALHFARFLARLAPELTSADKDDALSRWALELDNVRTAWRGAARRRLLPALQEAADPLFKLYDGRGWHREAESLFREALEGLEGESTSSGVGDEPASSDGRGVDGLQVRILVLGRLGAVLQRLGREAEAEGFLGQALALSREVGNGRESAFVLDRLSLISFGRQEASEAVAKQGEALRLRQELGEPAQVATSLNNLGSLHFAMREWDRAHDFCAQCLELQRELGDLAGQVISLQNLGHIALARDDAGEAGRRFQAALGVARRLRHSALAARALLSLGTLAATRGRPEEAERYYRPALARAMQVGAESLALDAVLGMASARVALDDLEGGLELVGSVYGHEALDPGSRASAERLLATLQANLSDGTVHAALQSARVRSLEATAARLVDPLPISDPSLPALPASPA